MRRVPWVSGDMLEETIVTSSLPVAVLFLAGDEPDRRWLATKRFEAVAAERKDQALFLRIEAEENPTTAFQHMVCVSELQVVVFRRSCARGRLRGEFTSDGIRKVIEAVVEEHYR
jgi:hypothetical protein